MKLKYIQKVIKTVLNILKKVLNVLKKHKWYKILCLFIANSQKPPASYMTHSAPRRASMRSEFATAGPPLAGVFLLCPKKKKHLIMGKHGFSLTASQCSKRQTSLSVSAVHQPFHISICITFKYTAAQRGIKITANVIINMQF